jgi:hypothetical protein
LREKRLKISKERKDDIGRCKSKERKTKILSEMLSEILSKCQDIQLYNYRVAGQPSNPLQICLAFPRR